MTTYSIRFKDADLLKIQTLVAYVQSLDFVESIEKTDASDSGGKLDPHQPVSSGFQYKTEICLLYPQEWVLLANTKWDGNEVVGGKVLLHHKDKRKLAEAAKVLLNKHSDTTHFFTGPTPNRATNGLVRLVQ